MIRAIAILAASASMTFGQIYPPRKGDLAVSIPFDFQASGKRMQAGEYLVRLDAGRGVLSVCEDGIYCVEVEAAGLKGAKTEGMELVFAQFGGVPYLTAVVCDRGECQLFPLLRGAAGDDRIARMKTRKLVIHNFRGLPAAWN